MKEKLTTALKRIREVEDLLVEVKKVVHVFDADSSWHKNYDDPTKHQIDTFNYFNLDPRCLATKASTALREMDGKLVEAWRTLREIESPSPTKERVSE